MYPGLVERYFMCIMLTLLSNIIAIDSSASVVRLVPVLTTNGKESFFIFLYGFSNPCSFLEGPQAALLVSRDFEFGHYKSPPYQGIRAFARVYSESEWKSSFLVNNALATSKVPGPMVKRYAILRFNSECIILCSICCSGFVNMGISTTASTQILIHGYEGRGRTIISNGMPMICLH